MRDELDFRRLHPPESSHFVAAFAARKVPEMTPDELEDEQFYRDTERIAFPKLDDHQLSLLEPLAERRVLKRGDMIFKAGQRDLGLTIVLRGETRSFRAARWDRTNSRHRARTRLRRRRRHVAGHISPGQRACDLTGSGDTLRARGGAPARVCRIARCQRDHCQCLHHAAPPAPARSGICRVARSFDCTARAKVISSMISSTKITSRIG